MIPCGAPLPATPHRPGPARHQRRLSRTFGLDRDATGRGGKRTRTAPCSAVLITVVPAARQRATTSPAASPSDSRSRRTRCRRGPTPLRPAPATRRSRCRDAGRGRRPLRSPGPSASASAAASGSASRSTEPPGPLTRATRRSGRCHCPRMLPGDAGRETSMPSHSHPAPADAGSSPAARLPGGASVRCTVSIARRNERVRRPHDPGRRGSVPAGRSCGCRARAGTAAVKRGRPPSRRATAGRCRTPARDPTVSTTAARPWPTSITVNVKVPGSTGSARPQTSATSNTAATAQ